MSGKKKRTPSSLNPKRFIPPAIIHMISRGLL